MQKSISVCTTRPTLKQMDYNDRKKQNSTSTWYLIRWPVNECTDMTFYYCSPLCIPVYCVCLNTVYTYCVKYGFKGFFSNIYFMKIMLLLFFTNCFTLFTLFKAVFFLVLYFRKLYVSSIVAVCICLCICCLILFFLFPRSVSLTPVSVLSVMVYFTPDTVDLEVTVSMRPLYSHMEVLIK